MLLVEQLRVIGSEAGYLYGEAAQLHVRHIEEMIMQYPIEMPDFPNDFQEIAKPVTEVLLMKAERYGTDIRWVGWTPRSSDACQLAFYFRNQLFFVCINAPTWELQPAVRDFFIKSAVEAKAIPCVFSVYKKSGQYVPVRAAWGLAHAYDNSEVVPPDLVTEEGIELTDRELQIEAVLLIARILRERGCDVGSTQSQLIVDPSIYYTEKQHKNAVIIRSSRLPNDVPSMPNDIGEIRDTLAGMTESVYFAGVQCGYDEEDFDKPREQVRRILRGVLPAMRFDGFIQVN